MHPDQIPYVAAAFLEELDKIAQDLNVDIPITRALDSDDSFEELVTALTLGGDQPSW